MSPIQVAYTPFVMLRSENHLRSAAPSVGADDLARITEQEIVVATIAQVGSLVGDAASQLWERMQGYY